MFRIVYTNKWLLVFLCSYQLLGCYDNVQEGLPFYQTPDFTPRFLSEREASKQIIHHIAPFNFMDQHGKEVARKHVEGKIHVANFIFTRCGSICPIMTENLKRVADVFRKDTSVVLLSYSVTPWIDSVPRLAWFADLHGLDYPQWHLLTGRQGDIYKLARQSYFAEEDLGYTRDSTEFLHTEHVLLVDEKLRIRGIYNGTLPLEMEQLVKDVKKLK